MVNTAHRRPDGRAARWIGHREGRRTEFVAAGAAAVDRYGPEASAEQIAGLAGISRSVLYRYFRDRDDLRQAVGDFIIAQVMDSIGTNLQLTADSTPRQLVEQSIEAIVIWFDEHPNRYQFLRSLRNGYALEIAEHGLADRIAALLKQLMTAFGLEADEAEPGAYGIVGMVEAATAWWAARRTMSREAIIAMLCRSVWALIDGTVRSLGIEVGYDDPLPVTELLGE